MLKALATAVAALMFILGAPAAGTALAGCADGDCPTWRMRAKLPSTVDRGDRATIGVRVSRSDGKDPRGHVTVRVKRADGGYSWQKAKRWEGERLRFRTTRLDQRGQHVLRVSFDNHRMGMAESRTFHVVPRD